jgi:hypothetical protein
MMRRYGEHLQKAKYRNLSRYGTIRTIIEMQQWLGKNRPEFNLLTVNQEIVGQYILALNDQDRSGIRRYVLRRFYRWAQSEKRVLVNPLDGMPMHQSIRKLCVCTDHQIRQIESFVKNQKSDPLHALLLTLSLYWGLSAKDMALASIEIHDSQISVMHYRQPLSRRRQTHYREQILKLPLIPDWLAQLQKRYIRVWRERYEEVPKSFPVQPLVLARRNNRHLNSTKVMLLFYEATIAATGSKIPPNVVRRTSAHIHTRQGDASGLTKLGWAQTRCHDFSIYPRTYFSPKVSR